MRGMERVDGLELGRRKGDGDLKVKERSMGCGFVEQAVKRATLKLFTNYK